MDKSKTCAFTGNRPSKLPWGEDETDYGCVAAKNRINQVLSALIDRGYDTFISGMAQGGDTYFAEAVLDFKARRPSIKLVCAVPCPDQTSGWKKAETERYYSILSRADEVLTLSEHYSNYAMHKRNRFMVDSASVLISLDATGDGGTQSTKRYATKCGVPIIEIF
jgi:uncharacterized phage-like protein YoqJ